MRVAKLAALLGLMVMLLGGYSAFSNSSGASCPTGGCNETRFTVNETEIKTGFEVSIGSIIDLLPLPDELGIILDQVTGSITLKLGVTTRTTIDATMDCLECSNCNAGDTLVANMSLLSQVGFPDGTQRLIPAASTTTKTKLNSDSSIITSAARIIRQQQTTQAVEVEFKLPEDIVIPSDGGGLQAVEDFVRNTIGVSVDAPFSATSTRINVSGGCQCFDREPEIDDSCTTNTPPRVSAPSVLKVIQQADEGGQPQSLGPVFFSVSVFDPDGNADFNNLGISLDAEIVSGPNISGDGIFASWVLKFDVAGAGVINGSTSDIIIEDSCDGRGNARITFDFVRRAQVSLSVGEPVVVGRDSPPPLRFGGRGNVMADGGDANDTIEWSLTSDAANVTPAFGANLINGVDSETFLYDGTFSSIREDFGAGQLNQTVNFTILLFLGAQSGLEFTVNDLDENGQPELIASTVGANAHICVLWNGGNL